MEIHYPAGTIPVPVALPIQKMHVLFGGFFFSLSSIALCPDKLRYFTLLVQILGFGYFYSLLEVLYMQVYL